MTFVNMIIAAKTFPVFRAVKDLLPEQIDDHYHGKGVFGSGTYYALEEETALKYATGEITSSFKKFAIILAYKMQAKNPLTLTPKLVTGLSMEETGGWITFKNDEDAEELGLHSSFERDRLATMASENDYDAIILKGPKNKVDGGNQVLIPVGSKVTLTPTHFSVLVGSDMAALEFSRLLRKKLGGDEYARHYAIGVANVPIAKLKDLTPLLKARKSK